MIFVTTGTQLPFDRLLRPILSWAEENLNEKVIAQTCSSELSSSVVEMREFIAPEAYLEIIKNTNLIISHAGMGTIITANEHKIPIVIMARKFEYGEHRKDHQLSTIEKFRNMKGVYVVDSKEDIFKVLSEIDSLLPFTLDDSEQRKSLTSFIQNEIENL